MRRWLGIALLPLLSGCIPIGIRGSNMPYASLARPLDERGQVIEAADQRRSDAGEERRAVLKAGKRLEAADAQQQGCRG
jgi:hypothetical protein